MATDCKDCPVGETCPDREKITRDTLKGEPGCCFGDWRVLCHGKCAVRNICETLKTADVNTIPILEES